MVNSNEPTNIEIYDAYGRKVFDNSEADEFVNSSIIWYPEANIVSGVYLIKAIVDDIQVNKNVVYLKWT